MTSWKISGIRFSVEYSWSINAYTLLLVSLHLSVSPLLFPVSQNTSAKHAVLFLFSHYVSCLLSHIHIRPPTHKHIHAVCPKHFQTHDWVCGDIRCICHASCLFKWNDSICHQKRFCSNVVIAYYILCAVHCHCSPFYLGYECMQYASVNISNSSMLHLHHV